MKGIWYEVDLRSDSQPVDIQAALIVFYSLSLISVSPELCRSIPRKSWRSIEKLANLR
jgi:hypothetical protein